MDLLHTHINELGKIGLNLSGIVHVGVWRLALQDTWVCVFMMLLTAGADLNTS